jgi:putative lipoic acid-binding regulatory protein
MAQLPFKINIESEGGDVRSYATGGFATTIEAGISASVILSRVDSMPSISYSSDDIIGSAASPGSTFTSTKNKWVSASMNSTHHGSGSITFHHTDSQDASDRLKRYRFFGDKVCAVLGIPSRHWIYPVNFQLSDAVGVSNYFSGDVSADTLNVANSFTLSPLASSTSHIRIAATSGSNDVFFLVSSGSGAFQKNMIQIGYNTDDDKYVIRGGTGESNQKAYIDGFSEIRADGLKSTTWTSTGDSDTRITMQSKDIIMETDGHDVFTIDYQSATAKRILCGEAGSDGFTQGSKFDFIVHASGSSNGMSFLLNCKGEEDEGFVGIREISPSYPLEVSEHVSNISIYAEYDVAAYSDIRVKTDIETITEPLDKVLKLRGVTFRRTDDNASDRVMMGLIAQETEPIVPEVVVTNENPKSDKRYGHKSISYGNLTGLLIEAVKEQQEQIEELKQQVKEIKDGSSR